MTKFAAACVAIPALLWGAGAARADLIINVGNHPLQPNMANQQVLIYVTSSTAQSVQAVQVQCQIAEGGAYGGGSAPEPVIDELDVVSGTIFANSNNGQSPPLTGYIVPQVASRGTITQSGSVTANGLLATVTIDTTNFFTPGESWPLLLAGTINGDTIFGDQTPTILNGTISIAPEPGTALLAVAGSGLLLARRRRQALARA